MVNLLFSSYTKWLHIRHKLGCVCIELANRWGYASSAKAMIKLYIVIVIHDIRKVLFIGEGGGLFIKDV